MIKQPQKWVTVWTSSLQAPYPIGTAPPQPSLTKAIPDPSEGLSKQYVRLNLGELWLSSLIRLRFSNPFGKKDIAIEDVTVEAVCKVNQAKSALIGEVTFGGSNRLTIPPGDSVWSDATELRRLDAGAQCNFANLFVEFYLPTPSGPLSWHAEALRTSMVSSFASSGKPYVKQEWIQFSSTFLLDALDMMLPTASSVIVVYGDSIVDGTGAVIDQANRWIDILAQRLQVVSNNTTFVVNAGIGGNQVAGPKSGDLNGPFPGGQPALSRMHRDVISLSGISAVLWYEGINDLAAANLAAKDLFDEILTGVARMRRDIPGVKIIGSLILPAFGSDGSHGTAQVEQQRVKLNQLINESRAFDYLIDFSRLMLGPDGGIDLGNCIGYIDGNLDRLHPNATGHRKMGESVNVAKLMELIVHPRHQ